MLCISNLLGGESPCLDAPGRRPPSRLAPQAQHFAIAIGRMTSPTPLESGDFLALLKRFPAYSIKLSGHSCWPPTPPIFSRQAMISLFSSLTILYLLMHASESTVKSIPRLLFHFCAYIAFSTFVRSVTHDAIYRHARSRAYLLLHLM